MHKRSSFAHFFTVIIASATIIGALGTPSSVAQVKHAPSSTRTTQHQIKSTSQSASTPITSAQASCLMRGGYYAWAKDHWVLVRGKGCPAGIVDLPREIDAFCNGVQATIVGTSGDDTLVGTNGHDVVQANDGFDTVKGRGGNDLICGGKGSDTLYGGSGNDSILGGDVGDLVFDGYGDDPDLEGNAGTMDTLFTCDDGNNDEDSATGFELIDAPAAENCNASAAPAQQQKPADMVGQKCKTINFANGASKLLCDGSVFTDSATFVPTATVTSPSAGDSLTVWLWDSQDPNNIYPLTSGEETTFVPSTIYQPSFTATAPQWYVLGEPPDLCYVTVVYDLVSGGQHKTGTLKSYEVPICEPGGG